MEDQGLDIDISRLDPAAAGNLRALFRASAGAARQAGREAEESFLLGLAGLLDSLCTDMEQRTGVPAQNVSLHRASESVTVPAGGLTAKDAARAAFFLIEAAAKFEELSAPSIAMFLGDTAQALTAVGWSRVRPKSSGEDQANNVN